MKKLLLLVLAFVLMISVASCGELPEETTAENPEVSSASDAADDSAADEGLWATALYNEDTTVGEGGTTVYVDVVTPEKTVTVTIKTDEINLGTALTASGVAEGEEGPYGLYIKKVNGISAVYETDGAYWSLSINGEAAATGADGVSLEDGMKYELIYTKE